jgi:hypothetical protein
LSANGGRFHYIDLAAATAVGAPVSLARNH